MLKKSSEPSFWEVMDSFVLVAYPSLVASRTLLQWLLACINVTLDSAGTNKKQKISGSSKSCWTPWRWVRFDLILTMRDIYINSNLNPLTKFTSSSRSTEFKTILPGTNDHKDYPNQQNSHKPHDESGILFWVNWKVNGNRDNNMIRISQWRTSHCRTNTSVRRKK